MATDFAPNYEKKFHSKILPGLIQLLEDNSCPRVQAHAGKNEESLVLSPTQVSY